MQPNPALALLTQFQGVLHGILWPFDEYSVSDAPDARGVFALWRYGLVMYYGCAKGGKSTIRSCLTEHLAGYHGPVTRRASHCSWEMNGDPGRRRTQLVQAHRAIFGAPPAWESETPRSSSEPGR